MTITSSLNIATNALSIAQTAIGVVSTNISNVDNENYSKQNVQLTETTYGSGNYAKSGSIVSFVRIEDVNRASNEYLEKTYRNQTSNSSYYSTYSSIATSVQDITNNLNSSTTGLLSSISDFYKAESALADNPTDASLRQNYLSAANKVSQLFNSSYNSLNDIQQSLVGDSNQNGSCYTAEIGTDIEQVNNLLTQLASVNQNIAGTSVGNVSNSALLDSRDKILTNLSQYLNINTTIENNGTATVKLGTNSLVSGADVTGYLGVETNSDPTTPVKLDIVQKPGSTAVSNVLHYDIASDLTGGTIGAVLDASCSSRNSTLSVTNVISNLNNLASTFAGSINTLQAGSTAADGTNVTFAMSLSPDYKTTQASTTNMFVNNTVTNPLATESDKIVGITAGNISINSALTNNLNLIATGRSATGVSSANVGDNSNLTYIGNTRTTKNATLGNQTFEGYISSNDTSLGTKVSALTSSLSTTKSTLSSVKSKLSSETGVNLDEELSKLMQFQQMYQASAQLFSTCNSIMETLINMAR